MQGKQLVLSPDARDGSLKVHQDMELYRWALLKDEQSVHQIAERRVCIQVVKGNVTINGVKASTSDGLAIWDEQASPSMRIATAKCYCSICRRFKITASLKPAFCRLPRSLRLRADARFRGFAASLAQCDAIDLVYI